MAGTYKPMAKGERILVNFSRWCKYELMLPDGKRKIMSKDMNLGQGMYAISIAIPHLYVGPHKNGETHSVSLNICEILYEPEQNLIDIFDENVSGPSTPSPPPVIPQVEIKRPRKGTHLQQRLDEVDGMGKTTF